MGKEAAQFSIFCLQASILGSPMRHFCLKTGNFGFQRSQPLEQGISFQ